MNTNDISTEKPSPSKLERFLVDSDIDPELVFLLRKIGSRSTHATWHDKIPNDDTEYLIWARNHGYILVCHDKHSDTKTKYSFHSEMYYHGGQVIRVGKPGQDTLRLLGMILAQRHAWQEHFSNDSGEVVVHPSGCNFTNAEELLKRSSYKMRLPFEDPSIPLKTRTPIQQKPREKQKHQPNLYQAELSLDGDNDTNHPDDE
ncbi:MAG: DUF5615 family PIN-like protein [Dehalococcoidales bacterium]|nr:DUF5615 family PIN-like protein [Dehalococcoidales bacterium]